MSSTDLASFIDKLTQPGSIGRARRAPVASLHPQAACTISGALSTRIAIPISTADQTRVAFNPPFRANVASPTDVGLPGATRLISRFCSSLCSQLAHDELLFAVEERRSNVFVASQRRDDVDLQLSVFARIQMRLRWFVSNSPADQHP